MAVVPTDRQFKGWTHNQVINEQPVPPKRLGEKQDEGSGPAIFAKEAKLSEFAKLVEKLKAQFGKGSSVGDAMASAKARLGKTPMTQAIAQAQPQFYEGSRPFIAHSAVQDPVSKKIGLKYLANADIVNRNAAQSYADSVGQHRLMKDLEGQGFKFSDTDKLIGRATDIIRNPWFGMAAPLAMSLIPAGEDEDGNPQTLAQTGIGQFASAALPFAQLWKGRYHFDPGGSLVGLSDKNLPPNLLQMASPDPTPPALPGEGAGMAKAAGLVTAFQKVASLV